MFKQIINFIFNMRMKGTGVEPEEDDLYGVIAQVRECRRKGYVSLCDLEVTSRKDRNF